MSLLNRLTIKNLLLNKKRTIVTIIGIMLSVALITAVAAVYSSGINSLIKFEKIQQGDFQIVFHDYPSEELNTIEKNRSIEKYYITKSIGFAEIGTSNAAKPYAHVKGFTKESLKHLSVKLIDGRLPENASEVVIPTSLKTNGRLTYNIGDTITLELGKRVDSEGNLISPLEELSYDYETDTYGDEYLIDTVSKEYKVVGIIERPAYNVEPYSSAGYSFITLLNEKDINGNIDVYFRTNKKDVKKISGVVANILGVDNSIYLKLMHDELLTNEEYEALDEQMNHVDYTIDFNNYLIGLESTNLLHDSESGLITAVYIVMGIIVFTSVFCIKNSFDISITEKIKQYGMLKSIGATKKQIKKNVFYEATILGVIGIPLGVLLGYLASFILILISNYYLKDVFSFDFKLELSFSIIAVIFAIVLGVITIYASAFRSARRASKISPIDSIRNSANIKLNSKKLKSPKLIKKIFGEGGEISYKNLKRNKKKYRTTVISIVVSTFIFIALSSFMGMAFNEVDNEIKVNDYNISYTVYSSESEMLKRILETTKLDNVENYSIVKDSSMTVDPKYFTDEYVDYVGISKEDEQSIYTITLGSDQYNKYIKSLGLKYDDIKNKAIVLNNDYAIRYTNKGEEKKYMRLLDIKVGDSINGTILGSESNILVGYTTDIKPFGFKNCSGPFIILSDEYFDSIAKANIIDVYFKSSDADKLQDEIELIFKGEDIHINNNDENVRIMNNLFTLIGIFLYGFIIVITLIGVTNIFNTITTNMELRKQEFAMLRSVGMTNKEFKRMIRLETLFMGLKALIFGVPIGIFFSYLIYHFLEGDSGLPYELPIKAIVIAIISVFLLISLIMKYSISKINKQNIIETIRNENI